MKYLKIFAIAIVAMFGFNSAKAQVAISAHIGTPAVQASAVYVNRPVYNPEPRRVVVVNRRYHRHFYRRPVVVERPVYYRHYPRKVIVRRY